jgi:uncharacterized Fe-S cluster-containing protein
VKSKHARHSWLPPGKNCGLCGEQNCKNFLRAVNDLTKENADCPYYHDPFSQQKTAAVSTAVYPEKDILGHAYDFILEPLPGEISARKIVLPFRADMVDKMKIREGDYVLGRPMGAGCPIPHVLQVIRAEQVTGLLYTWVVGPRYSREQEVKDVVAYHMIGFEGLAGSIKKEPAFGCRATFLPGFCMMSLNHTGLVNMLLQKSYGLHMRIEDIHMLAGSD